MSEHPSWGFEQGDEIRPGRTVQAVPARIGRQRPSASPSSRSHRASCQCISPTRFAGEVVGRLEPLVTELPRKVRLTRQGAIGV